MEYINEIIKVSNYPFAVSVFLIGTLLGTYYTDKYGYPVAEDECYTIRWMDRNINKLGQKI